MSALQPGDIISSGRTLYRHVGMVHGWNGWGEVLVIDNSPETGGVAIRTLQAFLGGSDLRVERRAHPSDASVWLQRARARLGQGYDLLLYNCEHFVYEVTEGTPWSPQLQLRVGVGAILGVATVGYLLLRSPSRSRAA
jgi:hypothetical protein